MVEYGAGGTITQAAEETAPGGDAPAAIDGASDSNAGTTAAAAAAAAPPPPAAAAATRRKRKAKGWFCPVCRQPYTSLLRLTTTPPDSAEDGKEVESDSHGGASGNPPNVEAQAPPAPVAAATPVSRGLGSFKPGFLRSLSRAGNTSNAESAAATLTPDVERGLRVTST
jgi:hypothetical protein